METATAFKILVACLMVAAAPAIGSGNLLTNGDYEVDPNGTTVSGSDFHVVDVISGWRTFAVAGGAATMTVTDLAASSGTQGVMLARDNSIGDSALDKDFDGVRESIPAEPRVYKFLVDVKDGGTYGGSPSFSLGSQFIGGTPNVNNRSFSFDPGADFQTIGITALSNSAGGLSTRFDVGNVAGRSVYLDNARVYDVTASDRMVNGGFENSGTQALGWRFFSVAGAAGSVSVSTDAASGNYAALLERTNTAGDLGLDVWDGDKKIAVIGGETISVSMKSKLYAGTDTILGWNVATFDVNGNFLGDAYSANATPGSSAYSSYASGDIPLSADVAFVSVGFRIWSSLGGAGMGSYLIDDVVLVPEPTCAAMFLAVGATALVRRRRRV